MKTRKDLQIFPFYAQITKFQILFKKSIKPPATIILITGDVNFAPDISDLKNRKKYNVILIYPEQVWNIAPFKDELIFYLQYFNFKAPEPLRVASNKSICYTEFITDLPLRTAPLESEFVLIGSIRKDVETFYIVSTRGRHRNRDRKLAGIPVPSRCRPLVLTIF